MQLVLWAAMNGVIIGVVWTAIVLIGRQRRLQDRQQKLEQDIESRFENLDEARDRISQLEERLDLSERVLKRPQDAVPREPRES
jgi:MFS superfamily sulfate permease-like transporter